VQLLGRLGELPGNILIALAHNVARLAQNAFHTISQGAIRDASQRRPVFSGEAIAIFHKDLLKK
jgi:hypothetical protein